MRTIAAALVLLALSALPATSFVYDTFGGRPVRWPRARATVYHDPATITGAAVGELKAALAAWSSVPGSAFVYTHGGASPSANVKDSNNGNTDVYFDTLPPFGIAVTIVNTIRGADITERDVAFNRTIDWTTNATNVADGPADFRTVALHELGHVLGLRHENHRSTVMSTGMDAAFAQHQLLADDYKAMRFLYPEGGPTTGPDLRVDLVAFTPAGAGPGDRVEVSYTIRNSGTEPSGAFSVEFRLAGTAVPKSTDRHVETVTETSLEVGVSRTGRHTLTIPADLPPGAYRPAVILDADDLTADIDRSNNAGASDVAIRVERDALAVPPVCLVRGDLGPSGRDEFLVEVMAGTRVKIKAKQSPGTVSLALLPPGSPTPAKTTDVGGKARLRRTVDETGVYRIWLDSHHPADTAYELKVRTKKLTIRETVAVAGDVRIPFFAAAGSRVSVRVKGRDGLRPEISVPGVDAVARTGSSGTKAKLGAFAVAASGTLELVIGGSDATTGPASYRIKIVPPPERPTLTR